VTYRIRPQAFADIEATADVIARDNPAAAAAWVKSIYAKCELVANHPQIGPARDDIFAGVRIVPVGNYLIFYCLVERHVDIVRVLHGARDLKNILGEI
jgi:toxin ParE1/3/4